MNINVTENEIVVLDRECWMCGTNQNITRHHTLYRQLEPKKNVIIPLCDVCHKKQHSQDISSLSGLTFKIFKTLQEGVNRIQTVKNMLHFKKKEQDTLTMGDVIKNAKKRT